MNLNSLAKRLELLDVVKDKQVTNDDLLDMFITVADDYTLNEVLDILNEE